MKCLIELSLLIPTTSPPSRGAWIEIPLRGMAGYGGDVAPLAGGVD